jgi:hypothetical protein
MRHRPSLAALASFFLLAVATPASALAADQTGSAGSAEKLEINSPSADAYLQFHGRLFVQTGKSMTEYRWGGTSCGSKTLPSDLVNLLVQAVRDNSSVHVVPRYQSGQNSTKCLVGFTVQDKR